ncbi:MAG TPA: M48 family metallopeptidase [Sedimentisphaerales bacterium]|nr:M48 family metallopeptidase [Sedimentisphaerales bacterium]
MKHSTKSKLVVLCGLVLLLAGCTQVEITGRKQFNLVPDSMMNSMSFQSYGEFISQNKLSNDLSQTQMVKRVGANIQKAVERYCAENNISEKLDGYDWEFNLVEDDSLNAWCMPGGKVVVYTGLLKVTQNEAGLATVMGHEIAHAFAKHGAERMTQGLIVELGGMALSTALSKSPEKTKSLFMQSYGIGTQVGVLLPYSRTHESEADHLGLIFMAMAGYNPEEAVTFWQRMAAAKQGAQSPEFLSTHPADSTRISNLQNLIPEAKQYYRQQ